MPYAARPKAALLQAVLPDIEFTHAPFLARRFNEAAQCLSPFIGFIDIADDVRRVARGIVAGRDRARADAGPLGDQCEIEADVFYPIQFDLIDIFDEDALAKDQPVLGNLVCRALVLDPFDQHNDQPDADKAKGERPIPCQRAATSPPGRGPECIEWLVHHEFPSRAAKTSE
jgi:hypothetical protein